MSLAAVRSRIENEAGPVRQEGRRFLTSRHVLGRVASGLLEHQTFRDWAADARNSVLVGGASVVAVDEARRIPVARPARWRELDWLENHPDQVALHRGHWVLVTSEGIAASSPIGKELAAAAREKGISRPFVLWIPEPSPGAEIT